MNEDATPEQLLGVGALGLCCCLLSTAGLIAVVVWLMRSGKDAAPSNLSPPPPVVPFAGAIEFHLSVIALAFDAALRPQVDAVLAEAAAAMDPVGARVALVQRVARALLGVSPQWRLFGYGEKDLNELSAAQQSYAAALSDFRGRAAIPGDGGALAVLTLVLCTRGRRLGVDRLDTRQQIHDLLQDRLKLEPTSLLGAEVVWAPSAGSLSQPTVQQRYPEMHGIAL